MKECPKCGRTYSDETLSFCLEDGSLLSVPSYDSEATLSLPNPTNPPVNLKITDKKGVVYELKNASISYSSGFGPSSETRGISVLQGATQGFLEWSRIRKLTFKTIKEGNPTDYEVKAELRSGEVQTVNLAKDWSMAAGGTGLLFGKTTLGNVSIKFSDIDTIIVLDGK